MYLLACWPRVRYLLKSICLQLHLRVAALGICFVHPFPCKSLTSHQQIEFPTPYVDDGLAFVQEALRPILLRTDEGGRRRSAGEGGSDCLGPSHAAAACLLQGHLPESGQLCTSSNVTAELMGWILKRSAACHLRRGW